MNMLWNPRYGHVEVSPSTPTAQGCPLSLLCRFKRCYDRKMVAGVAVLLAIEHASVLRRPEITPQIHDPVDSSLAWLVNMLAQEFVKGVPAIFVLAMFHIGAGVAIAII